MALGIYKRKRNLKSSKEPAAKVRKKTGAKLAFVIHEHHASHLHYDLRLEANGVLKSWAIPKKPSMDAKVKRLAIKVEDHPYEYKDFEGTIPSGYGAGKVVIWDKGTYDVDKMDAKESEKALASGLRKGAFHFTLRGKKMKGTFALIRFKAAGKNEWLLIKKGKEDGKKAT
jgi:bifunctional non-homologous end joining protein LigD